jgi:hypothetical protein
MAEIAKAVLLARKIFDMFEKGGWKRVSGAFCVAIIGVFIGIGGADVAHVWFNNVSTPIEMLHINYLWELVKMFFIVYGAKWILPHGLRIIIILIFRKNSEVILTLLMKEVQINEPKTSGIDNSGDPDVPQT